VIKIIESPREGMQGFDNMIPADRKVRYINALLKAGFDTVEIGSIVSPRVVPQMADSLEVLGKLDLSDTSSNRMFLTLNRKGADMIAAQKEITHISYPFSFSPSFLEKNVRSTVEEAIQTVEYVTGLCAKTNKTPVVYISYAFGNPYGDAWSINLLHEWTGKLVEAGAGIIPLSNVSMEISAEMIRDVFESLIEAYPDTEFGLHLHTAGHDWYPKLEAAYGAGVRRFDAVIDGHGGCPMSGKEMMGNLATQNLLLFLKEHDIPDGLDGHALREAMEIARETYVE
jgi:hydroxymethylglutaryl-CoA lyase